jgi:hypothetical protein
LALHIYNSMHYLNFPFFGLFQQNLLVSSRVLFVFPSLQGEIFSLLTSLEKWFDSN